MCSFYRKPGLHPGLFPSFAGTPCRDPETVNGSQSPVLPLNGDIPLCPAFDILVLTAFQR